jgi:hypothetical protein
VAGAQHLRTIHQVTTTNNREKDTTMTTYAEWHEQEQDLNETEYEALGDYLDNQHEDTDSEYDADIVSQFRDAYMGQWDSLENFVEEHLQETQDIPDWLRRYIDWMLVAQDWGHDFWESDNGHIFRAH